jgi:hypothetical protein
VGVAAGEGHLTGREQVDVEELIRQLAEIRDALLTVLEDGAKRPLLQRLEIGLSITRDGRLAFVTEGAARSLTLTLERSAETPTRARTTKEPALRTKKSPATPALKTPRVIELPDQG